MNIFVCVKQVPDTETKISVSSDKSWIDTKGVKWIMNPYDEFAVEEALKTKAATTGSTVTVITAGPKSRATDVLRTALAMGCDQAVLVDADERLDSFAVSKALAAAIKKEGEASLIFTGKQAIDDNAASVSQQLAEFLGIPHATVVSKISLDSDALTVERDAEGGAKEIVQLNRPCVVAANKGLNMPRYASLPGIMKAKKKPIKEYSLADLSVEVGESKIEFTEFELPSEKPPARILDGEVEAQCTELVQLLREEAKVI